MSTIIPVRAAPVRAASINISPDALQRRTEQRETHALFNALRGLIHECGPQTNQHDRLLVCIDLCLDAGVNTRSGLIGALQQVGFKRGHVAIILQEGTGPDPARHRWLMGETGTYSAHGAPKS